MVAAAPSGKKPLPEMMTSIRIDKSGQVEIIDQLLLPWVDYEMLMSCLVKLICCIRSHDVRWLPISTPEEAFEAIKSMKIRGAPAIASLAALTLRSYLSSSSAPSFSSSSEAVAWVNKTIDYLQSSRPTAVNLGEAMDRIRVTLKSSEQENADAQQVIERVKEVCGAVHEEDLERNMAMGRLGAEWLWKRRQEKISARSNGHANGDAKKGLKVITVCNTGSLATSVSHSSHSVKHTSRSG